MSVKAQMHEAKRLIEAGRYQDARRLLKTVNHPAAAVWLAKLDTRAPRRSRRRLLLFTVILLILALAVVLVVANQMLGDMAQQALTLTAP